MRKLFFVGVLLTSLFCGASVVLAKEDGTEDCDAVAIERVLAQARGVLANTDFLLVLKPEIDDTKNFVESMVAEQNREWTENSRRQEESFAEGKKEYDEVIHRYFRRSGQPKK